MAFSGLQLARAIQSQKFLTKLPPWVEHMRVHEENLVKSVERGHIISSWTPGTQFAVPDGYVQGGLISALADGAQALAILSTQEKVEVWVTMDLHTRFVRPIKIGEQVMIESQVLSMTKTSAVVESCFTLSGGKVAAKVTGGWRSSDGKRNIVENKEN